MKGYTVIFCRTSCEEFEENYKTLSEARKAARGFISRARKTLTTRRGFLKEGNLVRDNALNISHRIYGYETGVYIKFWV